MYAELNITPPDVVRVMPHRVPEPLLDDSWVSLRLEPGEALNTMFDASVQRKGQCYALPTVGRVGCRVLPVPVEPRGCGDVCDAVERRVLDMVNLTSSMVEDARRTVTASVEKFFTECVASQALFRSIGACEVQCSGRTRKRLDALEEGDVRTWPPAMMESNRYAAATSPNSS